MKKRFVSILLGILCLSIGIAVGQKKNLAPVTADFRNANMEQFVSELEKQTGLHFYYDPSFLDSINITLSVTAQPIEKVLDLAFTGSNFNYLIDDGEVYITKGIKLGVAHIAKPVPQNRPVKQITGDTIVA